MFLVYSQRQKISESAAQYGESSLLFTESLEEPKRKKYKKDAYFSDEEELNDDWWRNQDSCLAPKHSNPLSFITWIKQMFIPAMYKFSVEAEAPKKFENPKHQWSNETPDRCFEVTGIMQ